MTSDDDDLLAESQALLDDAEANSETPAQSFDLELLAETAALYLNEGRLTHQRAEQLHQKTEQLHQKIDQSSQTLINAPSLIAKAVRESQRESLGGLDKQKQALARQSAAVRQKGLVWLATTLLAAVLMGGLLIATWLFWFEPKIDDYRAYRDSHPAIERESVFGARVGESNGTDYIIFDEAVTIQKCRDRSNCAVVIK